MSSQTTASLRSGSAALDQWRGLALVLVLISHGFHETGRVDGLGRVGVNLFFFISGILVFRSLAGSAQSSPWQQARSFWYRRLRRLYPALLAYVAVTMMGWAGLHFFAGDPSLFNRGYDRFLPTLPSAILYYNNYFPSAAPVLGHLWSLACEMQFYLLAPLIFLAGGIANIQRNLVFGGALVILIVLGAGEPFLLKDPFLKAKYHFEFAVWPMMLGFFCEYTKPWFARIPARLTTWIFWITVTVCSASLVPMLLGYRGKVLVVAGGALLLAPCLLAYVGRMPLQNRAGDVMRWLGVRTYSIYLWQQPFTICFFLPVAWWPVGAMASIGVGALWFRWFEFPFLSATRQVVGGRK